MTDKTQILDVTYGTFSCRLEGFDDSVDTMKLVVGYFHELAGHDRFLNTALMAPDMDTLARLTGEQSDGDVDAEMDAGKLNLRLRDTQEPAAEKQPLRLRPAAVAPTPADDDDDDDSDVDLHDDDTDEAGHDDDRPIYAESVAAKLDRIRAVVGRGHVAETTGSYAEDLDDEDEIAPRGGVNPLAQRLAELARRNSELAAIEAGIRPASDDAPETQDDATWDDAEPEETLEQEDLAALDDVTEDEELDETAAEDTADAAPMLLTDPEPDEYEDEELKLANLVADEGLDLHAEVAEVEREIEDRNKRHALSRTADAAVSRILSQTDAQLNQPERRRQQDAFAQLKAAVAATEAARQLGDDGSSKRRPSEVYRHDLGEFDAEEDLDDAFTSRQGVDDTDALDDLDDLDAEESPVVDAEPEPQDMALPETPVAPEPVAARPVAALRLVASQRADVTADSGDPASLRLRQIAAKVDHTAARTMSFGEFADEYAAADLEDMIEAGAAYITFVLEEDDFSRPQVMKLVQTVSDEQISREDGLRCFGRLLRQNRIIKLDNGRFQIAHSTRFRPDGRSARG